MFAVGGALLGRDVWVDARRDVRLDARAVAALGADTVAHNVGIIWSQVRTTAGNPAVAQLLATPAECPIEFDLALFPDAHLDLVDLDGSVVCSSRPLTAASTIATRPG